MAVGWEREGEIGSVFMQISLCLHPVTVNFNDPNNLTESSVVRDVVIEEMKVRGTSVPGAWGAEKRRRAHSSWSFECDVELI